MRYVRVTTRKKAMTVHLETCRHAKSQHAIPWAWAGDLEPDELRAVLEENRTASWNRFCRVCLP